MSADRRMALLGQGTGNGKMLRLLASYTIRSGDTKIIIPATDSMLNSETLYLKFNQVGLSDSDWIYIGVDNVTASAARAIGYTVKSDSFDDAYPICRTKTSDMSTRTTTSYMLLFGGSPGNAIRHTSFENIQLLPYTTGTTFTSGTVEIWGWI